MRLNSRCERIMYMCDEVGRERWGGARRERVKKEEGGEGKREEKNSPATRFFTALRHQAQWRPRREISSPRQGTQRARA